MKTLNTYILIFFSLILVMSCEDDEEISNEFFGTSGQQWLQFQQEEYSLLEANEAGLEIPVVLAADSNPNGVVINLDFSTTANASGFEIIPADGVLEIPAGEFSTSFIFRPINNVDSEDDKVIDVSFVDPSLPVGLGGGPNFSTTTLTIIDDDCPFENGATFLGNYELNVTSVGIFGAPTVANGVVTLSEGATIVDRVMTVIPYPTLGAFNPFEFSFSLVCGEVLVVPVDNIGVGCGGGNAIGPSSTASSPFDLGDDNTITINFIDDVRGQCDGPHEVSFTLTKL